MKLKAKRQTNNDDIKMNLDNKKKRISNSTKIYECFTFFSKMHDNNLISIATKK